MALLVHLKTIRDLRGKGDRIAKVTFRGNKLLLSLQILCPNTSHILIAQCPGFYDVISGIRCVSLWTGKPKCADASPVVALKSWRNPLSTSAIPGGDERETRIVEARSAFTHGNT